jgi:hypothetical protein
VKRWVSAVEKIEFEVLQNNRRRGHTVCVSSSRTFIADGVDTNFVMYVSTALTTSMAAATSGQTEIELGGVERAQ